MQKLILKFNNLDAFELQNLKQEMNGDIGFDLGNVILHSAALQVIQFLKDGLEATQRRMMMKAPLIIELDEFRERKHLFDLRNYLVKTIDDVHIVMSVLLPSATSKTTIPPMEIKGFESIRVH